MIRKLYHRLCILLVLPTMNTVSQTRIRQLLFSLSSPLSAGSQLLWLGFPSHPLSGSSRRWQQIPSSEARLPHLLVATLSSPLGDTLCSLSSCLCSLSSLSLCLLGAPVLTGDSLASCALRLCLHPISVWNDCHPVSQDLTLVLLPPLALLILPAQLELIECDSPDSHSSFPVFPVRQVDWNFKALLFLMLAEWPWRL